MKWLNGVIKKMWRIVKILSNKINPIFLALRSAPSLEMRTELMKSKKRVVYIDLQKG